MKKGILILLITFISCSQNGKNSKNINTRNLQNWTEYRTKDSIPELLKLTLAKLNNGEFKIANPNEQFNATDVIVNDSLPSRQLILVAKRKIDWRIIYTQGGVGMYYVISQCKIRDDSIFDFKIAHTLVEYVNNDTIDKLLCEQRIKWKDIKITYE